MPKHIRTRNKRRLQSLKDAYFCGMPKIERPSPYKDGYFGNDEFKKIIDEVFTRAFTKFDGIDDNLP